MGKISEWMGCSGFSKANVIGTVLILPIAGYSIALG